MTVFSSENSAWLLEAHGSNVHSYYLRAECKKTDSFTHSGKKLMLLPPPPMKLRCLILQNSIKVLYANLLLVCRSHMWRIFLDMQESCCLNVMNCLVILLFLIAIVYVVKGKKASAQTQTHIHLCLLHTQENKCNHLQYQDLTLWSEGIWFFMTSFLGCTFNNFVFASDVFSVLHIQKPSGVRVFAGIWLSTNAWLCFSQNV